MTNAFLKKQSQLIYTRYLENFACLAWWCESGIPKSTTVKIEFILRYVRTDPVEAIAAIPATPNRRQLLLAAVFDEILNHLRQASWAGLELGGVPIFAVMRVLHAGLLRRVNPQNARELTLQQPLKPRLHHWLNRLAPERFFMCVRVNWLDLHRKRHDDRQNSHTRTAVFVSKFSLHVRSLTSEYSPKLQ